MGLGALRASAFEFEALFDAEAVLLVDDAKSELVEGDAFLNEGVRAYGDARGPALERFQNGPFLGGLEASGKFEDGNAERLEPLAKLLGVLFRKEFRRGHEDGLMTALEGAQQRESGDDRLAASHVSLYEAVHGRVLPEILFDFPPDALLRVREREGKRGEEGVDQVFARLVEVRRLQIPSAAARLGERDLLREKFVEFESLPGRGRAVLQGRDGRVGRRIVQVAEGGVEARQTERFGQIRGYEVAHVEVEQRTMNALSKPRLLNSFARRIDGGEGLREIGRVEEGFAHLRVHHLEARFVEIPPPHLSEDAHDFAVADGGGDVSVVREERESERTRVVGDFGHVDLSAARRPEARPQHRALTLRGHARVGDQFADRSDGGFVFIAQRQMKDEVPIGKESEPLETFRERRKLLLFDRARHAGAKR